MQNHKFINVEGWLYSVYFVTYDNSSKGVTTNKKLIHQADRNKEKGNLGERKVATQ
jgi:hypothetical protein